MVRIEDRETNAQPEIEGYTILGELGRGGQAYVYRARQDRTDRLVAIKVLRNFPRANAEAVARFSREIRLLAQVEHPQIVSILHSGQLDDGRHFYVMEYVLGKPVRQFIVDNELPLERILDLFATIARIVACLHQRGIIHRDLKPSNILVDEAGHVKVLDFGLAKNLQAPSETLSTSTGTLLGSLVYMSPEQARGRIQDLNPRSDVYSLGVLLFEMVTGVFPYDLNGQLTDIIQRIVEAPPKVLSRVRLESQKNDGNIRTANRSGSESTSKTDSTLDAIVTKTLEKEQDRRYADAGALAQDIEDLLGGKSTRARPQRWHEKGHRQLRRWTQRNRRAACAIALVAALLLTVFPGVSLVFLWTPINRIFETALVDRFAVEPAAEPFENLRIVAIKDHTDIEGLARNEGIEGVSIAAVKSWRRLHGRFMEKMVDSGCRALAWDITFANETDYDKDFARGVHALVDSGVDVIVAVSRWWLEDERPLVSTAIGPVRFGAITLGPEGGAWAIFLWAQRGLGDPLPSLVLETFAASRNPGVHYGLRVDKAGASVLDLVYKQNDPQFAYMNNYIGTADRVRFSAARRGDQVRGAGLELQGFPQDKRSACGLLELDLPNDSDYERVTVDYADAFRADRAKLREWFSGRIVLIGNARTGIDLQPHSERGMLPGYYAHAAGLDALQSEAVLQTPQALHQYLVPIIGLLVGALLGFVIPKRALVRIVVGVMLTGVFFIGSVVAYTEMRYLLNPVMIVLPMVLAAESIAAIQRIPRL